MDNGTALWRNGSFNATVHFGQKENMDQISLIFVLVLVLLLMFALGCTMEPSKIKAHLKKPKGVFIGMVTQYGIMPLTAFCLAKAFRLTDMDAIVVLVCGCCPGGTISNFLTLMLKGDINLSFVMTICSTVISLGMLPLLLLLYCQGFANLHQYVPYKSIIISLVSILMPCGFGILLSYCRPRVALITSKVGILVSTLGIFGYCIMQSVIRDSIFLLLISSTMLAIAFLMPLIGFFLGYVFSWIFQLSQKECWTVSMETGCQNVQVCTGILKMAFAPEVLGTLDVFPAIYLLCQFLEGMFLTMILRTYHHCANRQRKDSFVPAKTEMEEVP